MSEKKTPGGILVRKVQFEFPEDFAPHWNPAKPVLSQILNGASLLPAYFEPYLVDSIRKALPYITDPALRAEAEGFMGQESQHFIQHRRFNKVLLAKGYEDARAYERQLERDYEELARTRSLQFHIAYATGFETLALALAPTLIALREYLFKDADPAISSFWLWHMVEEIEHKKVAFSIYQHLYGGYWYRVYGLVYVLLHLIWKARPAYIILLKADGLWGKWRTRWAIKKIAFRFFALLMPRLIKHALPGHDPVKVADPAWMREWVALYDQGEKGLLKLDTTKIHLSPAAMLPT